MTPWPFADSVRLGVRGLRRFSYTMVAMVGPLLAVTLVTVGVGLSSTTAGSLSSTLDALGANHLVIERSPSIETTAIDLPVSLIDALASVGVGQSVYGLHRVPEVSGTVGGDIGAESRPAWPVVALYGSPAGDPTVELSWGRWPGTDESAAVVGRRTAGAPPIDLVRTGSVTIEGASVPIVGSFAMGRTSPLTDDVIVVSRGTADDLDLSPGPQSIYVYAHQGAELGALSAWLERTAETGYPDLAVDSRPAFSTGRLGTALTSAVSSVSLPVGLAVLGLTLVIQAASVLLQVRTRSSEIAVRLVLGHRTWEIARTLTLEALLAAIAGSVLGALLAHATLILLATAEGIPTVPIDLTLATPVLITATIGLLTMLIARLLITQGIADNLTNE